MPTAADLAPAGAPTFADLGVPASVVHRLSSRGIDTAFPIQAATIPDALAGRDVCGRAATGSGKTIAFGIPLIARLDEGPRRKGRKPRGLVLVPTRELAAQVHKELLALTPADGLWVDVVYGGVGFDRQIKNARNGIDVLVACPGRLADLINQGYVHLDEVEVVVVDEADRMADMGFLPEVRRLLDRCSPVRQTLLFSATLDGDVDTLITQYQHDPARHELDTDEGIDARADHHFWTVDNHDRVPTTAKVIKHVGPTVVFTRTKHGADRVAKQLDREGVAAAAIHGGRSQNQRDRALDQFHRGEVHTLVATDVAARGIHVDGVAAVVHFDPPADEKDSVPLSGRTARAGNEGVVVSLVTPQVKSKVSGLQKALELPKGTTAADVDALPKGEHRPRRAPTARAERPARAERTAPSARSSRSTGPERPSRSSNRDRVERSGPARTERPERTPRTDRAPRTEQARVADRPKTDRAPFDRGETERERPSRQRPAAAPPSGLNRKARRAHLQRDGDDARGAAPAARAPRRDRDDGPAPTADKNRPSGAARRKAKREAAAEREALGLPPLESITYEQPAGRPAPKPRSGSKRIKAKPNAKAKARTARAAAEAPTARRTPKVRTAAGRAPASSASTGRAKAPSRQGTKPGPRRSS